ncbi:MAG: uncharacterized SAM-binding protein YcdF (DUF218 family) [Kiritimatiellia bacterium]|jgi:uncharacterized SAM-binding protein YcdF (DUF218 family)
MKRLEQAKVLWTYHCTRHPLLPADVIIGFGSYDLRVAEHAAALYRDGWAPRVLFTGHQGNWTRDLFDAPEAEVFKQHAVEHGVPEEQILVEPKARNNGENLRLSRELLAREGVNVQRAILVQKPQTTRRAWLTARKVWPELEIIMHHADLNLGQQPLPHHSMDELIHEMVGDLQRNLLYPEQGFQVADEMPDAVLAAYEALIEAGFTKHLSA